MSTSGAKAAPVALGAVLALLGSPNAATAASTIWTVLPTPNPGAQTVSDIYFTGVSASSVTDAWAVGIDQIGAFRLPLAAHWNGQAWSAVRVASPAQRQAWFNGVLDLGPTNA
ncbi:MAG TPA: hypothetical protein VF972_04355, partial [Actinomycetota bacterium]